MRERPTYVMKSQTFTVRIPETLAETVARWEREADARGEQLLIAAWTAPKDQAVPHVR